VLDDDLIVGKGCRWWEGVGRVIEWAGDVVVPTVSGNIINRDSNMGLWLAVYCSLSCSQDFVIL
jgi:hypothetical protein